MTKALRTLDQLQDALDAERIWRLRELSTLRKKLLGGVAGGISNEDDLALLRPCVTMIYAHWEGFVKAACSHYLQYVALQRLPHNKMATPFLALSARRQAIENGLSGSAADRFMLSMIRSNGEDRGQIPYKAGVDTKGNLRFDVLQELFDSLGLSCIEYELRQKMIDSQLVAKRNAIAHGRYIDIQTDDVTSLFDCVIDLMEKIKDQLIDAALNRTYTNEIRL